MPVPFGPLPPTSHPGYRTADVRRTVHVGDVCLCSAAATRCTINTMRGDDEREREQEVELLRRGDDLAGRELVTECEAFLEGRYAEHLSRRGRPIPVWVWTNLLAHGTPAELRRVARSSRRQLTGSEWASARQDGARQVLETGKWGGSVAHVQATILVPLELALAACPDVSSWQPAQWTHALTAALQGRGRDNGR